MLTYQVLAASAETISIASFWVGVGGLAVTVAGFTAALIQLTRTRRAAQAAANASREMQSTMQTNHLLVLLPQLERVENDLMEAVKNDSIDFAMFHLTAWRWQAGQIQALLATTHSGDDEFLIQLQKSVVLATQAKKALLEKGRPVMNATKRARDGIASVTDRLGALTVELSTSKHAGD